MSLPEEPEAWLERGDQQHILQGSCSIGRATLNTLIVDSAKVSRLHAIIHSERTGVFWLVDLGSSNGTFLNKRRIHEPTRLRDCDQITIGGNTFIFRQSRDLSDRPRSTAPVSFNFSKTSSRNCRRTEWHGPILATTLGEDRLCLLRGRCDATKASPASISSKSAKHTSNSCAPYRMHVEPWIIHIPEGALFLQFRSCARRSFREKIGVHE